MSPEAEKTSVAGNLEFRINGGTRLPLSTQKDGFKVVERALIGYASMLLTGKEPSTAALLSWLGGFRSRWGFSASGIENGAPYDVIIVPEKNLIAYNNFHEEDELNGWVVARKILEDPERFDYKFKGYKNVRAWENAHGPVQDRVYAKAD